ncbi:hypothetical protein TX298_18715 [Klebsiella pneumoniae]|uniref:hypothetical protein n=1 Tax=Klebsiella pneumoniae TaxID=573 RepID=UPI002AB50EAC|nr:hypothetical protein [Klebsiella pneumoniae]MDY7743739.1 hypothetical protein [Klebsiella pneumoniae]
MTKSTITREQRINEVKELIANAEEWAGYYEHPIHDKPQREIFEGMARVMAEHLAALTAMDSEPVALQPELAKVIYHFRDWNEGFPVERFKADYVISWMLANYPPAPPAPVVSADLLHTAASAIEDLLTTKDRTGACVWFDLPFRLRSAANAQPATVVPEEKPIPNTLSMYAVDAVAAIAEVKGWNACRAAMLERQLVDRVDEKSLTSINPAPDLVSLQKKAESIIGNYPGIPDGYVMVPVEPNGDMLAAAQDAYGETDGDIASTLRAAMLSGGKS